jgi:flagellar basal body-associated protein FliL
LQTGLIGVFRMIERWASESPERSRILIIMIWVVFGVLVLVSTGIAAWIMLPRDARPF